MSTTPKEQKFAELKNAAISLHDQYSPIYTLVEDVASGQSLIQEIERETDIKITRIIPRGDKVARAWAVTPLFEAEKIFLPNKCWTEDYIENLCGFPNLAHDDDVDSTTMALLFMKDKMAKKPGIFRLTH